MYNQNNCNCNNEIGFFSLILTGLLTGGILAFLFYMIGTSLEFLPKWIFFVTTSLFVIGSCLAYSQQNFKGLSVGGFMLFLSLMAIFFFISAEHLNIAQGTKTILNTNNMISLIIYFPILSGVISIIGGLGNMKSASNTYKGLIYLKDKGTQLVEIKKSHLISDKPTLSQIRFYDLNGKPTWTEGYGFQSKKIYKQYNQFYLVD